MFLVMEIQRNGETVNNIVDSYTDENQAKSKYHLILASAAVSTVERHSAVIIDDTGRPINYEWFDHDAIVIE